MFDLKSKMVNDFKYCTNGMLKLMLLLKGPPITVRLYIRLYYELFDSNCNDYGYSNDSIFIINYISIFIY